MLSRRSVAAALAAVLPFAGPARAEAAFNAFLADVRREAVAAGVRAAVVDRAFAGLRPNPKVLELDDRPPERTQNWDRYRATRLSDQRVTAGRQALRDNADVLREVNRRFGVDPSVIVSIWGLETNYGGYTGGFPVIEALATLAADGRRDNFFRRELVSALRILDHGDISLPRMTGSYAGAMGQPQFMPSSFLNFAVSFDGGERRDIWDNRADALASIGNYLARSGWRANEGWGRPVRVPPGFAVARDSREDRRPVAEWARLGVATPDNTPLAAPGGTAAVVMPDGAGGEAYLVFANFAVIRLYNRSDLYALSVGLLADRLAA